MSSRPLVAPSLLSADFSALAQSLRRVEDAGADLLHVDIMDGMFVPNISFGPAMVETVRGITSLFLDVHLMIEDPIRYVDAFASAGADGITVHVEACENVAATLEAIREHSLRPGITLKPGTPFTDIEPFLELVELVLIMTVEPGFGGQSYLEDQEPKLSRARQLRSAAGHDFVIEVDGGIGTATARRAVSAGAEILVAGSALFGAPDISAFVSGLQSLEAAPRR
ncbi:MAG: ribulose-phosphate 3-epimerase [Gemmatimonadota bacterium]|nr:MAG: ribulose-phosphate 3-epimerase [Gemmatimonadota bacterium]